MMGSRINCGVVEGIFLHGVAVFEFDPMFSKLPDE